MRNDVAADQPHVIASRPPQSARQLEAIAHVEAEKRDVCRARDEFESLYGVEQRVEFAGARFGGKKQGGRDEDQEAVADDERHALELGSDQTSTRALGEPETRTSRCRESRDQRQETPGRGSQALHMLDLRTEG
ncbi:MAG: hypothetical protein ACLPGW_18335 [Roseiarcus sp.]